MNPALLFNALKDNLSPLGYRLNSSSMARIGNLLKNKVFIIMKKMNTISNGDSRRSARSQYWASPAIHPDEILSWPKETIDEI